MDRITDDFGDLTDEELKAVADRLDQLATRARRLRVMGEPAVNLSLLPLAS